MEKKTLKLSSKLLSLSSKNPMIFIGERGTRESVRSRASNLNARLHTRAVKTQPATRAAPPAHAITSPLSAVLLGFWIWAPGFNRFTLQSKWLYVQALNHQINEILGFFFISCHGPRNIQKMSY